MNLFEKIKRKQQKVRFDKQLLEREVLDAAVRFAQQSARLNASGRIGIQLIEGEALLQAGMRSVQEPYYLEFFSDGSQEGCLNAGYVAGQTAAYLRFRSIFAEVLDSIPECMQRSREDDMQCSVVVAFGGRTAKQLNVQNVAEMELPCIRIENEQAWSAEILDFIKRQGLVRSEYTHMVYRNGCIHFLLKTTARRHPRQAAVDAGVQIANVMAAADELWIDLETVKQKEITESGYLLSVRHKEVQHRENIQQIGAQVRYA